MHRCQGPTGLSAAKRSSEKLTEERTTSGMPNVMPVSSPVLSSTTVPGESARICASELRPWPGTPLELTPPQLNAKLDTPGAADQLVMRNVGFLQTRAAGTQCAKAIIADQLKTLKVGALQARAACTQFKPREEQEARLGILS